MKLKTFNSNWTRLAAAIGIVLSVSAASAYAARDHAYDIVYYSDATHTEEVGRRSFTCSPGVGMYGEQTEFTEYVITVEDCNQGFEHLP